MASTRRSQGKQGRYWRRPLQASSAGEVQADAAAKVDDAFRAAAIASTSLSEAAGRADSNDLEPRRSNSFDDKA